MKLVRHMICNEEVIMLVKEAIEDFLAISEAGGLSPHTVKSRKTALYAFSAWESASCPMAEYDVEEVYPRHIVGFLRFLRQREGLWHGNHRCQGRVPGHLKDSSIQTYFGVLKTFFRWLAKRARRQGNNFDEPTADIPQRKTFERIPQALTLEEITALLVAAEQQGIRELALLLFLVDSGCRISEAIITLADIEFGENVSIIKGKGGKTRPLFFTSLTAQALQVWLASPQRQHWAEMFPQEAHYVFLGRHGHLTDSGFRYIIRKVGESANIKLHPHQLRHTLAVTAFEQGAPTAVVSQIMGHSSSETTLDIYGVFSLLRLKEQHEKYSTVTQVTERLTKALEADEHIFWYNITRDCHLS